MKGTLKLSQVAAADALLSKDPLALLIGMVLDQQVPLEWAFQGPLTLQDRLGRRLDATDLAAMDTDELTEAFCRRPAIHRVPAANARRVQAMCRLLVERYDAKAARVWTSARTGDELLAN
ncbi:MAG: HhH-GPD-type base excision DNA repair protein, partial [Acidimicrobiales bacterium]